VIKEVLAQADAQMTIAASCFRFLGKAKDSPFTIHGQALPVFWPAISVF